MNAGIPEREVGDACVELEVVEPERRRVRELPRDGAALRLPRRCAASRRGSVIVSARLRSSVAAGGGAGRGRSPLLATRAATQPLDVPSCGSVFKNPPGDYAGRLIEAAGLKGTASAARRSRRCTRTSSSTRGGATASDVLALIRIAQERVREHSGARLEPEVRIVGGSA